MIGERFSRLTVIARAPNGGKKDRWVSSCQCGGQTTSFGWSLRAGRSRSCGCLAREELNLRQGHDVHYATSAPEYLEWQILKARCYNPRNRAYSKYGGRGVRMCDEWRDSFLFFIRDLGPRPSAEHIVMRDNDEGDFTRENCKWILSLRKSLKRARRDLALAQGLSTTSPQPSSQTQGEIRSAPGASFERAVAMNGIQSRAARSLLGITGEDLARMSRVSVNRLREFENGKYQLGAEQTARVRAALIVAGVEFLSDEDGFGVKLRSHQAQDDEGEQSVLISKPMLELDPARDGLPTPSQCRAARGFLKWSQPEAARALGLGLSTIAEFENASPRSGDAAARKIQRGFERHGILFGRQGWRATVSFDDESPADSQTRAAE